MLNISKTKEKKEKTNYCYIYKVHGIYFISFTST